MADWLLMKKIDIHIEGDLYLRRWVLVRTPWFQVMLHKILRPDADRELHSHPWWFRSIILKGGYVEEVLNSSAENLKRGVVTTAYLPRRRGELCGHDLDGFHRIDRLLDGPAWTLVFTKGKEQAWGFLVNGKWVHNQEYLKAKGYPVNEDLADDW